MSLTLPTVLIYPKVWTGQDVPADKQTPINNVSRYLTIQNNNCIFYAMKCRIKLSWN